MYLETHKIINIKDTPDANTVLFKFIDIIRCCVDNINDVYSNSIVLLGINKTSANTYTVHIKLNYLNGHDFIFTVYYSYESFYISRHSIDGIEICKFYHNDIRKSLCDCITSYLINNNFKRGLNIIKKRIKFNNFKITGN